METNQLHNTLGQIRSEVNNIPVDLEVNMMCLGSVSKCEKRNTSPDNQRDVMGFYSTVASSQ